MNCKQAKKLISEYVDGALDERRTAALEKHLAACADCRETLKDFQSIVREARSLKTVTPPDAVWQKVSGTLAGARLSEAPWKRDVARLRPSRAFFLARHPVWSAAAAALVVVVGGLFLLKPWQSAAPAVTAREQFTLAKLAEAEGYYRQAIKSLTEAAAAQTGTLDPRTAEAFKKNLTLVDGSIEACQKLVRRDPRNLDNQNFLLAAYKDKVDILTDLVAVKRQSGAGLAVKTSL